MSFFFRPVAQSPAIHFASPACFLFVFGLAQTKVAYYYRRPLISRIAALSLVHHREVGVTTRSLRVRAEPNGLSECEKLEKQELENRLDQ